MGSISRGMLALAMLVGPLGLVSGQEPAKQPPSASESDVAARRAELFASDRWLRIIDGLRQWASTTKVYTPEQIEEIRQQYSARVREQSPEEIERTMASMEKWLEVVLSPEARQANALIAKTLSLQSESAAARTRERLPDVAFLTAAELERELIQFQKQRASNEVVAAAMEQARTQQIDMTQRTLTAQRQAQQQANAAARSRAAARRPYQSPLSPPEPTTRIDRSNNTQFFFDSWGRTGVVVGGHRW